VEEGRQAIEPDTDTVGDSHIRSTYALQWIPTLSFRGIVSLKTKG